MLPGATEEEDWPAGVQAQKLLQDNLVTSWVETHSLHIRLGKVCECHQMPFFRFSHVQRDVCIYDLMVNPRKNPRVCNLVIGLAVDGKGARSRFWKRRARSGVSETRLYGVAVSPSKGAGPLSRLPVRYPSASRTAV